MSLEATILEITNFISNEPVKAALDIGNHLLTGTFLVQRYFPEAPVSKKIAIAVYAGTGPDFDHGTFGLIPHKTATHTPLFAAIMGINAYNANSEDRRREGLGIPKGYKKAKYMLWDSRWAKLTWIGFRLHLAIDFVFNDPVSLAIYGANMTSALNDQMTFNRGFDRYNATPVKQKIVECIVTNAKGVKYWVNEWTENRLLEHEYDDYNHLPQFKVPYYKYQKGRELVRQEQVRLMPKVSRWEKIDDFFLRKYMALTNRKSTLTTN